MLGYNAWPQFGAPRNTNWDPNQPEGPEADCPHHMTLWVWYPSCHSNMANMANMANMFRYGKARKIHYTADTSLGISWSSTGGNWCEGRISHWIYTRLNLALWEISVSLVLSWQNLCFARKHLNSMLISVSICKLSLFASIVMLLEPPLGQLPKVLLAKFL